MLKHCGAMRRRARETFCKATPTVSTGCSLRLTTLGYTVRAIALTSLSAVPPDCSVVAEIGPRHAYAPAEAALLSDYLARGGRLLAMIDPEFPLQGGLGDLFGKLGLALGPGHRD